MDHLRESAHKLLVQHAKKGNVVSYREFARQLGIETPPIVSQVTKLLEQMMVVDVARDLPILAALVVQKNADIPRVGFFEKLYELGVCDTPLVGESAMKWHQNELKKIKQWAEDNET